MDRKEGKMKDVIFREKRLIDREKEIEFFKEWFEKLPEEILWVYGPKSTGKTTILDYVLEDLSIEYLKIRSFYTSLKNSYLEKLQNKRYLILENMEYYNYNELNDIFEFIKLLENIHIVFISTHIHNFLKVTSEFYKIDHLDKETTIEWLKEENFSDEEISLIWEYLGGCIPLIQKMMRNKNRFNSLEEYLQDQQLGAWSEIIDYLQTDSTQEEREIFRKISKDIVLNEKYVLVGDDLQIEKKLIEKWCEKEILFFEPRTREVKGNNRLYEKGLEKYLKQYNII
jgi:AAA+ ATPase superfamily predicted ATPase